MTTPLPPAGPPQGDGVGRERATRTIAGFVVLCAVLGLLAAAAATFWVQGGPADGSADRAAALRMVTAVCGTASLGGWIVARLGAGDPALAVSRSLAAILLRLLLPLALLGWLSTPAGAWPEADRMRQAGAVGLLVVFYLSLLATDILLHIMWGPKGPGGKPHERRSPAAPPTPAERADSSE